MFLHYFWCCLYFGLMSCSPWHHRLLNSSCSWKLTMGSLMMLWHSETTSSYWMVVAWWMIYHHYLLRSYWILQCLDWTGLILVWFPLKLRSATILFPKKLNNLSNWHWKDWTIWLLLTYLTSSPYFPAHSLRSADKHLLTIPRTISHPSEIVLFLSLQTKTFETLSQLKFVRLIVFNILSRDWKHFYSMWHISAKLTLIMLNGAL